MNIDLLCDNVSVNNNELYFAGRNVCDLADKYGTPLYIMDENKIRENCRTYSDAMKRYFGCKAMPLYASKAASFKAIYSIVSQEDLGIDVVSSGEIYTAISAGISLENAYFHSNNKTDEDIAYAIDNGIGYFVVDNEEELKVINDTAKAKGICQKILLRLTPGIDPHTYAAVATGKVDSKFGSAIETGQAEEILLLSLSFENIDTAGFHCHVGSMVFDESVYKAASEKMLSFVKDMYEKHGYKTRILNIGGGFGVRYVSSDPIIDIAGAIKALADEMKKTAREYEIELPEIRMEPGRSIVANAGITIYTVGTVKKIPGYKNYVSIDGGMTDNPRYALYSSKYTVLSADNVEFDNGFTADVVGRCCESGDIIQPNVKLPSDIKRGAKIAVLTTGAYNYSMASNYNRIPRPAVVMLSENGDRLVVKRESLEDIVRNDI